MKYNFIILAFTILFSACSSKNAFSDFKMNPMQEQSVSNLQSSKLTTKEKEISGVVSAVYLNEIYPHIYNDKEYFFIYAYLKENKNSEGVNLNIKLNSKSFINIRELPKESRFSNLVSNTSRWNKYYLATFEKDNNSSLELVFIDGETSSSSMIYRKIEE